MQALEFLNLTAKYAHQFNKEANENVSRNCHMNDLTHDEVIESRHIEAILVGFVNFIGGKFCVDYGFTTHDLRNYIIDDGRR